MWLRSLEIMKNFSILFALLLLAFGFGATSAFAQEVDKSNNTIVVKVSIPENPSKPSKVKIAKLVTTANKSLDDYAHLGESPPWKIFATTHCIDCPLANFGFGITSNKSLNEDKVELKIQIDFEDKENCSIKKKIFVIRGEETEIRLKCGIKLIAHYGFELKKIENNEQPTTNN